MRFINNYGTLLIVKSSFFINIIQIIYQRDDYINKKQLYKTYAAIMAILAIISILLLIGDYNYLININSYPWNILNYFVWIIFVIDYAVRLHESKHKSKFIIHNIFDLLAIMPFDFLGVFRVFRAFRLLRIFRAFRLVGFSGRLIKNCKRFLKVTGMSWVLMIATALVLMSALLFSLAEKISFGNALWWSLVTTTTVGYGDITPKTVLGRAVAVALMFTGIGVVGILTSSITNYFSTSNRTSDRKNDRIKEILLKLNNIEAENKQIHNELRNLKHRRY